MAYAALISLKQTIQRLLTSHISVVSSSRETLDHAYTHLTSLQEVLKRSDDRSCNRKRLNPLEEQIKEILHQLEDLLEFQATDMFLSRSETHTLLLLELDLKEITPKVEAMKKMEKQYAQELENPVFEEEDLAADAIPSRTIDPGVKMVGLSETFADLKDHLTRIITPDDFGFFSFFGLPGTGRSIVAKRVYDDIYAVGKERSFDCGAWVRIGSAYTLKQILLCLISEIDSGHQLLDSEGEDKLSEYLYSSLEGKRYIIALDDIRDTEILVQLRRSLPEQNNGSLVFVTTSLMEVAEFDGKFFMFEFPNNLDEFFWYIIWMVYFGVDVSVSLDLVEAGKKIAKNCGGLPLVLARIILILQKFKKTPETWSELAAAVHDRVYVMDDEISEVSDVINYLSPGDYEIWAKLLLEFPILVDRVKEHLYPDRIFPKMGISTICGMAGVGKTTLMKKLFDDHSVLQHYNHCAWVDVGSKYKSEEILVDILAQIYPNIDRKNMEEDANLVAHLCLQLSSKKCLIMLDDVWSQEPVHYLKKILPNMKGELMVTTRLLKVGFFGPEDRVKRVRLLNNEESWDLLREKVFGENSCPLPLEVVGKKIAENCEGLPLLILVVADLLSKSEITLEHWKQVAENKIPIVMDAQNKVSRTLTPSYECLPQHLKACFLYMGVFPQKHEISRSKLMKLWFVEGFLEPNPSQTIEDCASRYLKELIDSNMLMVRKKSSYLEAIKSRWLLKKYNTNKSCSLHSVFWHLSCNEAMKNNFFHSLNTYSDSSMIQINRRLCIRKSILLGFKDVYDEVGRGIPYSTSRSFLCTGQPHKYPVPLYFGSKLLRVIDALTIRFYEFPIEIVELIHLRYLALTCNGKLPSSISKLWNLQFLIVFKQQEFSIKSPSDSSYLPIEIWYMKELKLLQITGSNLPNPNFEDVLPNLSSLLDVSVHSCTKRVFKRIPNLRKLSIQIELAPDDSSISFHWLNHISYLPKLESLKCVVVNPELGLEVVVPPNPPTFPSSLKKLSLSGLGLPWEYMSIIGKLQNLEVLKIRCYAFVGLAWEVDYDDFPQLKFLSIEDVDLVRWDFKTPSNISSLHYLRIKHCYDLEQLPSSYMPSCLEDIEVIESHPLAVNWAKQVKEKNIARNLKNLNSLAEFVD